RAVRAVHRHAAAADDRSHLCLGHRCAAGRLRPHVDHPHRAPRRAPPGALAGRRSDRAARGDVMLTIIGVLFALFLVINLPVAFALALASSPAFLFGDYMPPSVAIERMYGVTQSYPLLAVPFFILGGNLMNT